MGSEKSRLPNRDSLGWLASSSVVPQKRKEIEGVSNSSLVNLQAQLFQTQENVRLRKDGHVDVTDRHVRRKAGIDVSEVFSRSNAGVNDRDKLDRLQLKTTSDKEAESYAALERKAALYEKLRRGEAEDEAEAFEVDFLRKGMLHDEEPHASGRQWDRERAASDTSLMAVNGTGGMVSADMERERERRQWEEEAAARMEDEWREDERRRNHKEAIHELEEETREGRERAARTKARKEDALEARRERLKQEFLRRQVQKLKSKAGAGSKK